MPTTLLLSLWLSLALDVRAPGAEDPFKLSPEMEQFLESNIEKGGGSLGQLRSLVRVVFQENALDFRYVPVTRTAIETYEKRGGNCVSFTFLFIAMARHLGLDARFREVEIVPVWSRLGRLVSISGHANTAIFIGGQVYSVDLFPEVSRVQFGGRIVSDQRAVAHYWNNKGVDRLACGDLESAIIQFQAALESDPSMPGAWINLGVARAQLGDYREAEKAYFKVLDLDPRELIAMSNLASLYQRTGRHREAIAYQARIRKFRLRNPYYHFDLGLQAYDLGRYRESAAHFKAALRLKSSEHNFHLALARAYAQLGDMNRASASLKLAAKYAPDEASKVRYNEKLTLLAARQHHS